MVSHVNELMKISSFLEDAASMSTHITGSVLSAIQDTEMINYGRC